MDFGSLFSKPFDMLGSGLNHLFPDASRKAMPYLNDISGTMRPMYEPYMQAGQHALGPLESSYGQMLSDPGALMSRLGQGYQKSPGYDFQMQQGLGGAQNAAAAGGMLGSPQHQQQASQFASQFANQDYNKYLEHAMGMYGQGQQGMMGLATMGQGASSDLAQSLAQALMSQGSLAYAGQANQNQQKGGLLGNLAGLFGGMFGG